MEDNAGKYYIFNGILKDAANPVYPDANKSTVAYEVLRVIEGVAIFYEDHYIRLVNSILSLGEVLNTPTDKLKALIKELLSANQAENCNIKIAVYNDNLIQNVLIYISKSYYPTDKQYEDGVNTGLLELERRDPNAKIVNTVYKEAVAKKMQIGNLYEILLVNNNGEITEGSRSNVFFVKGNKVYTAPESQVLKGVTRKYVIEAVKHSGLEIIEECVSRGSLKQIEGAFLSGTSIKALPILSIDSNKYRSGQLKTVLDIRSHFDKIIIQYIERNK